MVQCFFQDYFPSFINRATHSSPRSWKLRKKCSQGPCSQYKYTTFFLSLRRFEFLWPCWILDPTTVRGGAESLKCSHKIEDGQIFLKTSASHSLMTTYRIKLLSTRSISLGSTFKRSRRKTIIVLEAVSMSAISKQIRFKYFISDSSQYLKSKTFIFFC